MEWKIAVQRKRLQRERAITEFKDMLDSESTDAPPVDDIDDIVVLVSKVSKGDLTSEEVTKACIERFVYCISISIYGNLTAIQSH